MAVAKPPIQQLTYHFQFMDGRSWTYELKIGSEVNDQTPLAPWTELDFYRCKNCPLDSSLSPACPLANGLHPLLEGFKGTESHDHVQVKVDWRGREILQTTTIQRAASSLMGAVSANSGCPHTRFLKPMVWFHQPLSQADETLFRALGSYLLAQKLRAREGKKPDWELENLLNAYQNVRIVNRGISRRIQEASTQDSEINGLILLDLLASDMLNAIENYEGELDGYFAEFLELSDK